MVFGRNMASHHASANHQANTTTGKTRLLLGRKLPAKTAGVSMYCGTVYTLAAFEDLLPSECSDPPGTNPIRQVKCDHTPDSPTHSFETCMPTWMPCSQPERIASPARSTPTAHLQTGRVPVTKDLRPQQRAPADSKSVACWGRAINRGFKDLVTMVEAPLSDVPLFLCVWQPTNEASVVAQGLSTCR
jgi:hypothetical protein